MPEACCLQRKIIQTGTQSPKIKGGCAWLIRRTAVNKLAPDQLPCGIVNADGARV